MYSNHPPLLVCEPLPLCLNQVQAIDIGGNLRFEKSVPRVTRHTHSKMLQNNQMMIQQQNNKAQLQMEKQQPAHLVSVEHK
jgi:hypothetical protein